MQTHRANILIVADRTADSPQLLDAVARRAIEGPCSFTLLVLRRDHDHHQLVGAEDHQTNEALGRLDTALPLLSQAAGYPIVGMLGSHEPLTTITDAINLLRFDEVIISTLPGQTSQWLPSGLPRKVRELGVTVTEVIGADTIMSDVPAA